MRGLSKVQIQRATTTSPYTRDFRHLLPFPRHWLKRQTFDDPKIKSVSHKDRIKYWNIVPGDLVADLKDPNKKIRPVIAINKISSKVFLKRETADSDGKPEENQRMRQGQSIHYSRCQLYLGDETFDVNGAKITKPVFALRMSTRNKDYSSYHKRYIWDRYPAAIWPRLPRTSTLLKQLKTENKIKWPVPERRTAPDLNEKYDTPREVVTKITYKPFELPEKLSAAIPRPPSERDYINSLFNPRAKRTYDKSQPTEILAVRELTNPHSRAKKQQRWQQFQQYKSGLKEQMVGVELKSLNGRNVKEATAEATYKWRQWLEDEKKAKRKQRWLTPEREAKMERKNKTKEKKKRRVNERLRDLVLQAAPNQVLPKAPATA